jgi:hypothetical protein
MSLENEVKRLQEEKRKKKEQEMELKKEDEKLPKCVRCGAKGHTIVRCKKPK